KALYRVVGYRVCGERAVRVDILERLADLIRPALAWKPGAAGMKPAGAVEGGGFTVTVSMTSLTGASGEDFGSILRSLGYRMERRPKPPEPEAPANPPAEAAAPADAAQPGDEPGVEPEPPAAEAEAPSAEPMPTAEAAPAAEAAPVEHPPEPTPVE